MGGRLIKPVDEDKIIDDYPVKAPVGRERRKRQYQADRAAQRAQRAAEGRSPYPGYVAPESMFPDWDWAGRPEGPPLDDPMVAAYTNIQWKSFLKNG